MQEYQNFTVRLPRALVKRAKRLAVDRDTSVSALLTETLQKLTREEAQDSYEAAHGRWLKAIRHPMQLGTRGKATWTRDELHERR